MIMLFRLQYPYLESCSDVQVHEKQQLGAPNINGGIVIREAGAAGASAAEPAPMNARMQADADYARQLQAKLDAAEARGAPRCVPWPAGSGHILASFLAVPTQCLMLLAVASYCQAFMPSSANVQKLTSWSQNVGPWPTLLVHDLACADSMPSEQCPCCGAGAGRRKGRPT